MYIESLAFKLKINCICAFYKHHNLKREVCRYICSNLPIFLNKIVKLDKHIQYIHNNIPNCVFQGKITMFT